MYVPVDYSNNGSCGIYYFVLPFKYRLTDFHIVDPFDKPLKPIEDRKHFQYQLHWDENKQMQIVQMALRSGRGSFSFILKGKAELFDSGALFLESIKSEINLDDQIHDFFFDEGIKKSFWKNLKESLLLEPNFNGIGIDFKKLFKK
jgi:hypothetical protein